MTQLAPEREGVIKFTLDFACEEVLTAAETVELSSWRDLLVRVGVIGCDPHRYNGLGYGNISCRSVDGTEAFIISGSQTGELTWLEPEHYARVDKCDPTGNAIKARGLTRPSSEAMTHGQLYLLDKHIMAVVHGHSPTIWRQARKLDLLSTPVDAAYGTVAMAEAVESLFLNNVQAQGIFVMGGHEDGVVSFGASLEEAGLKMMAALARGLALEAKV